jgi:hypothetical protein
VRAIFERLKEKPMLSTKRVNAFADRILQILNLDSRSLPILGG